MKTIRYCNDPFEAQVIRGRLEDAGIPACVVNENINTVLPLWVIRQEIYRTITIVGSVVANLSAERRNDIPEKALSLQSNCERNLFGRPGATGFDSRQSLIVSTPSFVRWLVNLNARTTNGDNSYALAA